VEAPIDADNHGVFFLNSSIRSREIPDGLTHTIFVGEKMPDSRDLTWLSGTVATLRNTGTPLDKAAAMKWRPSSEPYWDEEAVKEFDYSYGLPQTPPEPKPAGDEKPKPIPDDPMQLEVGGFSSFHSGAVNFLFGDGTVRSVSTGIDVTVYQQLGHRADGKLLEDRSFE
jgi:prepilin-type processing-associated H-X9-DG protein